VSVRMNSATIGLCAVLAMGLAADAASAKKVSRAACYSAGDTLVATQQVRVFQVGVKVKPGDPPKTNYYACNQPTRKRFLLLKGGEFKGGSHSYVGAPAINGNIVAFARATASTACSGPVVVFDTKRGKTVRKSSSQPSCASSIVVSARGFAAWTYTLEYTGAFVAGLDSSGTRVLGSNGEEDPPIELNSLYLNEGSGSEPDIVAWVQDGRKMTAELK
jgi:hypothetical protein